MPNYTPNFHLKKDLASERYSVETANGNSDIIDSTLKSHADLILGVSSVFRYLGTTTNAELPTSGMRINDTYYVTDLGYNKTWNGTAWLQSSMPIEIDSSLAYAGKAADAKATGDAINAIGIEVDDDGEGNVTLNIVK